MKKLILLSVVVLSGISACKKEKSSAPATPKIKTIATLTASGYTDTNTYVYDAQERIASVTRSDGYLKVMTYSPGRAINTYYPVPGVIAGTETFFLDANGIADSVLTVFGVNISHTKYIYDSEGHQTIQKFYDDVNAPTSTRNFIWDDGNKRELYIVNPALQMLAHVTYNFVPGHKNTTGNQNYGLDMLGIDSQNPIASRVETSASNSIAVFNYTYTYDSEDRIASMTLYTNTGSFYSSETYTYY